MSLSIGLLGVAISFVLGCLLGGISGYFAGPADMLIQRIIEFLGALPSLPLWMALAAAVPLTWPPLRIYFMITVILSMVGWTGLARTVRSKLLQLRVEDHVMAAKIAGMTEMRIIVRHMLPGFMSYLIVHLTMAVPGMILGETALSFIGIGLRPPVVSWGVMLQQAQNVRAVALTPWLMIPAIWVVMTVLVFNFVGDGLRDAADPYKVALTSGSAPVRACSPTPAVSRLTPQERRRRRRFGRAGPTKKESVAIRQTPMTASYCRPAGCRLIAGSRGGTATP